MKYDVVIVGGGAAGCVLAGRLAATRRFPCCYWRPDRTTRIRITFPRISSSATPALPKPEPQNTTGPCTARLPRNKAKFTSRSEEHTSELQSQSNLVCR